VASNLQGEGVKIQKESLQKSVHNHLLEKKRENRLIAILKIIVEYKGDQLEIVNLSNTMK